MSDTRRLELLEEFIDGIIGDGLNDADSVFVIQDQLIELKHTPDDLLPGR